MGFGTASCVGIVPRPRRTGRNGATAAAAIASPPFRNARRRHPTEKRPHDGTLHGGERRLAVAERFVVPGLRAVNTAGGAAPVQHRVGVKGFSDRKSVV